MVGSLIYQKTIHVAIWACSLRGPINFLKIKRF